jgi:hypothetical protein
LALAFSLSVLVLIPITATCCSVLMVSFWAAALASLVNVTFKALTWFTTILCSP